MQIIKDSRAVLAVYLNISAKVNARKDDEIIP
jgi:hypothetical protein